MFDPTKTLTELEGKDWGTPTYPSQVVTACHEMRYKPVGDLDDSDIRIAISQQMSLPILAPLALRQLRQNPWLEADFFEGDLLKCVLEINAEFWASHPSLWSDANEIALSAWDAIPAFRASWQQTVKPELRSALTTFQHRKPV